MKRKKIYRKMEPVTIKSKPLYLLANDCKLAVTIFVLITLALCGFVCALCVLILSCHIHTHTPQSASAVIPVPIAVTEKKNNNNHNNIAITFKSIKFMHNTKANAFHSFSSVFDQNSIGLFCCT